MAKALDLQAVAARDGRYHADGFRFVAEALGRAADLFGKRQLEGSARHLTAAELVTGAVDLAAERWSLLGDLVLAQWGIRSSADIGEITFALIAHGIFSKEPGDRLEDFAEVHRELGRSVAVRVRERAGLPV
jgi:uncharacterized repeat protein (TIGR04138 family)